MTRVLFICGKNRLRSPSAEHLFAGRPGIEVASAGLDAKSPTPVCGELLDWAEIIFVMEESHRRRLAEGFRRHLKSQRVICLGIADEYRHLQPELMSLLEERVTPHLGEFIHPDMETDMETHPAAWERCDRRTLFQCRILAVDAERAVNPRNGHSGDYYSLRFPDWVNVVAITAGGELVMIRQYRHGSQRNELEIPGGCIDAADPDPLLAGLRELAEETGYHAASARLIGATNPNPAIQGNTLYTLLAEGCFLATERTQDEGEDIEVLLLPASELRGRIRDGEIGNALVIAALYLAGV